MRTYRIGAFARFTQTPIKTLRHYDAIGLLRPAHVDRRTGYRHYTGDQVEQLNRILVLKDLGCSLREIRGLLADRVPRAQIAQLLAAKHADLARHVAAERQRLARAAARLALLDHEVAVRTTAPQLIASVRATLADHAECDDLFAELPAHGERGAIWHACAAGTIDCEAFVFLPGPIAQRGRMRIRELPARRVASLVYRGEHDYLPAYRAIRGWLATSRVTVTGAKRELFLGDAVTEIQFPIATEAA